MGENKALRFMMTTNGITDNREIIGQLDQLNLELDGKVAIIVSLDGSNDVVNAQLRGPGNFEKTRSFIENLQEAGITIYLNNVVHRGNLGDIDAFVELAINLGVAQANFLSFVPKGQGVEMLHQRPRPLDVFRRIHSVWEKGDEKVRNLLAGSLSDILNAESCGTCTSNECVGGYRGLLYIVPDGTAYSCPNLNHQGLEAGNILKSPLEEIHDGLLENVYQKVRVSEDETGSRYLCKGEKYMPNTQEHLDGDFAELQRFLETTEQKNGLSYCFSRNF